MNCSASGLDILVCIKGKLLIFLSYNRNPPAYAVAETSDPSLKLLAMTMKEQ